MVVEPAYADLRISSNGRFTIELEPGLWYFRIQYGSYKVLRLLEVPAGTDANYEDLIEFAPGTIEPLPPFPSAQDDAIAHQVSDEDSETYAALEAGFVTVQQKGAAAGVATLDEASKIPEAQVPPRLTDATLQSTFTAQGIEATQRIMALLHNESRNASLMVVGDSTGNETTEWVYLLATSLGADFPKWTVHYRLWNDTTKAYDAATVIQTGTGARTLTIWNASVSGFATISWQGSRARAAIYDLTTPPDLIMVSMGHNEQVVAADIWYSRYLILTESIAWGVSTADIILIAQNPATANTNQELRRIQYREIAARRGYGFIDVGQAFTDTGNPAAYIQGDGIHPNAAGEQLWHDTVKRAFKWQPLVAPRTQQPPSLLMSGKNLLLNADLSAKTGGIPDNWAMTVGATAVVDATDYETFAVGVPSTGGGTRVSKATKLTAATGVQSTLSQFVPIPSQGCWVTWGQRVRVPVGSPGTVARMAITATGVNVSHITGSVGEGAFSWQFLTTYIPAGVDTVRVIFYIDQGTTSGVCTLDRQFLVLGKFPAMA
ncbi:MAG: SGNH/GDSL hydrolase family protein [Leifsonia sp.]